MKWRQRGDEFERLMLPHIDALYRLAYRFVGSRHDAEDLVQDLLVELYPKRAELLRVDNLRPWLARSLYNRFIDTVRRAPRDPLHGSEREELLLRQVADGSNGPEGEMRQAQLRRRLDQGLRSLSAEHRALVALHDMEGYTLGELQQMLALPVGTLKSRLHRARAQLREWLCKGTETHQTTAEMAESLEGIGQ